MKRKIIVALLLVAVVGIAAAIGGRQSTAQQAPTDLGYLNMESHVPLIIPGRGGDNIVLRVAANHGFLGTNNITDQWAWRYAQRYMNLKIEVEALDGSSVAERRNLMLASNDLPDMMIGMGFNTSMLMDYGTLNKQLLPLDRYLSNTLTPNIQSMFRAYPAAFNACTAPDGHIYTLPLIERGGDADPSGGDNFATYRMFINQTWLDALGMENPRTIDQFLNTLRAFKQRDPGRVGSANVVPMSANDDYDWTLYVFAPAYGVLSSNWNGAGLGITTDGRAVYLAMEDYYLEYLRFMNTCYNEGLISPDYFTMSETQVRAMNAEGRVGVINDWAPYLSVPDTYKDWVAVNPLTRSLSDRPVNRRGVGYDIGGFVVSANTRYPELCLRFADYFFTSEGHTRMSYGPLERETDLRMGLVKGFYYNDSVAGWPFVSREVTDGDNSSFYDYRTSRVLAFNEVFGLNYNGDYFYDLMGLTPRPFEWNLESGDHYYRYTMYNATHEYLADGFPPYVYLGEADRIRAGDLSSMINPHVVAERAKFISGARPLSQFNAFRDELRRLGVEEYVRIYANAIIR